VRAKALAGLGRLPEARGAIASLYHLPALRAPAAALAAACGLRMPGSPVPEKDRAAAAETARRGLALFEAGDLPGAEAALAAAAALDPSDAEAQLSLCSARYRLKEYDKALEACDFADIAADAVTYPEARRRLISEALLTKGIIREALGRRAEAAADLRKALQDPPKAWPLAAAAGAELEKLEPALKKRR
jgi:tetratricopeptide (TPR) repeat protein